MSLEMFRDALNQLHRAGERVVFWLRDDDAVQPTLQLDRLLTLAGGHEVPLTLAVIPMDTGDLLARELDGRHGINVAVHGWSHENHAGPGEKKQELGLHRPLPDVTQELKTGLEKLSKLYREQFIPMLVPPWNRIAPEVVASLPELGFRALSVFGPEQPAALPLLNTHVDIMDWKGTLGGREPEELFDELAKLLVHPERPRVIGILAHHLVHDDNAWRFLGQLFEATTSHAACGWVRASDVLDL